ncbi:MAG: DUF2867 domain-containing protein [Sediminibacterium sp.]|nr:DUF2867 domain-containing protein [Sediminibacterium sp.]
MNFITEKDEKYVLIANRTDLDELINQFKQRELFAYQFKFSERELFINLLESLEINYEDFEKKYFYFDGFRKLHISESEFGYVWISTYGLIAKNKATSNRAVNSCINQYSVIKLLLDEAIKVIQNENVYDVDSYGFGYLSELSPAIFHNLIFYVEVFCKAYLSIAGEQAPNTHKLSLLYKKTAETMVSKKHNDSLLGGLFGLKTSGKITDRQKMLDNFKCEKGEQLGLFKIFDKTADEIILGEDDKHLNFRVSLFIDKQAEKRTDINLIISTTVKFNNWFGRIYFLPVRPFHKLIVPTMLKGIIKNIEQQN